MHGGRPSPKRLALKAEQGVIGRARAARPRWFVQLPGTYGLSTGSFAGEAQLTLIQALTGRCGHDPAQQAIRAGLLTAAGLSPAPVVQGPDGLPASAHAAAMRFTSLPPASRHAWLQNHLVALAAGRLTTPQIP